MGKNFCNKGASCCPKTWGVAVRLHSFTWLPVQSGGHLLRALIGVTAVISWVRLTRWGKVRPIFLTKGVWVRCTLFEDLKFYAFLERIVRG